MISSSDIGRGGWTFLSNHGHVLVFIARNPRARMREVAEGVGITERATQRIVADLVDAGYLTRTREGRRNSYRIHLEAPLRHALEREAAIGALLEAVGGLEEGAAR